MKPQRIHLSRAKGFNLQVTSNLFNGLDAVNVARPGPWGNPFIVGKDGTRAQCVYLYRMLLGGYVAVTTKVTPEAQQEVLRHASENLKSLRGKNLACWCPATAECHADVLLKVANKLACEPVPA